MNKARDPDALRAAMAARDLTHSELATLARCAKGMVSRILAGHAVNRDLAVRMARILRRPVDDLFEAAPSSTEQSSQQGEAVA